jgi:hypothetical protein
MLAAAEIRSRITQRPDPASPILLAQGRSAVSLRADTIIEHDGRTQIFDVDTPVKLGELVPGTDYAIGLDAEGWPFAAPCIDRDPVAAGRIAGFHFSPGGNAEARAGGDAIPGINPFSLWDLDFRPACDPRGMVFIQATGQSPFWADIYLLGTEHQKQGTSRCGAEIADGRSLDRLDYPTAAAIYAGHGKRLMTYDEFRVAAFGVTERSAADRDPKTTGLDPARTSRFGLMQATGNLWVWGTDGDPDDARPSFFGGSWIYGDCAGSRYASLDYWPVISVGDISARGACDHLSPV